MTSSTAIQRTLALIKPDAVNRATEIEKTIGEEGFTIVERRTVKLNKSEAEQFYEEHTGKPFFESLIEYMTAGEVLAFILSREEAVAHWRKVLGPTKVSVARQDAPSSLRARFGDPDNDSHNGTHGSDAVASAQREIKFFFPDLTLDAALTGEGAKEYLSHAVSPLLVRGLTELCRERPEEPITWLADWLLTNNPNKA
uniref:Nucleoside diphosphate kinase homolog 5 n=1 Tax=Hirondellea gigas TaxID=1518452 RepID=A0A2P2I632_9CRUS